jgi:hypothetical protein
MAATIARSRAVRSAANRVSTSAGDTICGESLADPDERDGAGLAAAALASCEATRDRVGLDAGITPSDQVGVEARHRRQPTGDRRRRQTRLAIRDPHHGPVATLVGQEVEHVRRHDIDRGLVDHGEERLQIMGGGPHRVRPAPPRHERQVAIDKWITQRVAGVS